MPIGECDSHGKSCAPRRTGLDQHVVYLGRMSVPTTGSIEGVKLSVSLPEEDVALLDEVARERGLPSRSAALQEAIRLLRESGLSDAYAAAWSEWETSEDQELWDEATGDGLS
ncbi:ribbon-helix-helix domain-containing protein [Nocardia sp. NPDC003482]